MQSLVGQFNEQLKDALRIGRASQLRVPSRRFHNVVIAGMGGSGIGGSVSQSLLLSQLPVPVTVVKTYRIPAFVGADTLFIACSFSGNTEETLAAVADAEAQGATIVAITTGGQLHALAQERGYPCLVFPGESKQPRANIGYAICLLHFMLAAAGLLSHDFVAELEESIALLEQTEDEVRREAAALAQALHGRLPIVYADSLLESTAVRFQQQVNENSKQLCHVNSFPEMNHNEIVGWEYPANLLASSTVLLLHTASDHPRVRQRMELCRGVFERQGARVLDLTAEGASMTSQVFYLIHLLDWASVYLAEANGTDPNPVRVIDRLKEELAAAPA